MFAPSRITIPLLLSACASTAPKAVQAPPQPAPPGWSVIGSSVEGRSLLAKTRGRGPWRVYLIGGIHGDERPAVENAQRLSVLVDTSLPPGTTVRLVQDANPDGTEARTRQNAHQVDLNRNWPASNFSQEGAGGSKPLSEPECRAVHADILRFAPSLVIALHAARRGPFVNFDGPGRDLAQTFVQAARTVDPSWHVLADMGYATPGSLGTWIGVDRGVPTLTVELDRDSSASDAWPALRSGLLAVLAASQPTDQVERALPGP